MTSNNLAYLADRGVKGNMVRDCLVTETDGPNNLLTFKTFNPFNNSRGSVCVNTKYPLEGDDDRVLYPFPPQQFYGMYPLKRKDICILVEDVFDVLSPGLWGVALAYGYRGLTTDQERWLVQQCFAKIIVWADTVCAKHTELVRRLRSYPRPDKDLPPLEVVFAVGWAFDPRPPCEYGHQEAFDLFWYCQNYNSACPPYYGNNYGQP